jgi:hypothetical protein
VGGPTRVGNDIAAVVEGATACTADRSLVPDARVIGCDRLRNVTETDRLSEGFNHWLSGRM